MKLTLSHISFGYGTPLLRSISCSFIPGQLVFLLGRNGAGKSTLLKLISGILENSAGEILLDNQDVRHLSPTSRASRIGIALQSAPSLLGYTVRELVLLGRTPKLPRLAPPTPQDEEIVSQAIRQMGLDSLQHKPSNTLSGGEYQRAKVAALLALQSQVLLLDEPFSGQDPVQTHRMADVLQSISRENIVIVTSHDLALTRSYADRVLMLSDGGLLADGPPHEVLTEQTIRSCYSLSPCSSCG